MKKTHQEHICHLCILLRDGDLGGVDELEEGGEGVRVKVLQHNLRVLRLNKARLEHPEKKKQNSS